MTRKICAVILALSGLCCLCSCGGETQEQLYVSFYGIGESMNPQDLEELMGYEPEKADFHELDALYFSGTQLRQYLWDGTVLEGTVSSGDDGSLLLQYEDFTVSEESADMPDSYKEAQESSLRQYMSDANETGGLISMYPSGVYRIHPDADGWTSGTFTAEWSTPAVYRKGSYIVTEQTEYSLNGTADSENFSLNRGDAEHAFSSDGTWTADGEAGGLWELSDDGHILAVYSETDDSGTEATLFYVDFQSGEVHIPLYLQCDDLLDEFHQQQSE